MIGWTGSGCFNSVWSSIIKKTIILPPIDLSLLYTLETFIQLIQFFSIRDNAFEQLLKGFSMKA